MESRIVSRREFLNDAALVALAISLSGCTKSVTKYRPDGTPYTEEEDDWVGTLAAVVLFILVLAIIASNKDDGSSQHYDGDWQDPRGDEGKIRLASMGSKRTLPIGGAVEKVSVTDCTGKLLVTADVFEHVEHQDLEAAESLLASAQIFNLQKPIVIRLLQDNFSSYRIKHIGLLQEPSDGDFNVFYRRIKGKLYKVKIRTLMGNSVDVEIIPQILRRESLI